MARAFIARYDGHCAECHDDIEEGDLITYSDDDETVHEGCA